MARGAAIRLQATPLEALVVGQVAAYGSICWLKDREIAEDIVQRNGRNPHPGSVSRARRNAARLGLLHSQRVFPGQRIPGKARPVTYGTTAKIVIFDQRFGVRDPLSRGQRRRLRLRQMQVEADFPPSQPKSVEDRPKHSAAMPDPDAPWTSSTVDLGKVDPGLAAVIQQTAESLDARQQAQYAAADRRMMDSVHGGRRRSRGPPE